MDAAGTAANWLSFTVTAIGLGSLITQANAIQERLDPYHSSRTRDHLGLWFYRQDKQPFFGIRKPRPVGPIIHAKLTEGFCGANQISVSRLPKSPDLGTATWTSLLATFHERTARTGSTLRIESSVARSQSYAEIGHNRKTVEDSIHVLTANDIGFNDVERGDTKVEVDHISQTNQSSCGQIDPWRALRSQPLQRHSTTTGISISRTSLITILGICNARTMYRYSDASGHRASYASYCGHFYIEWPLGGPAVFHFHPHDSHTSTTDVYPPQFDVRVDKCIHMMAGIITSPDGQSFQCAFPGRKAPGNWVLDYQRKGFPGAHGSRHLYNLMGGKVYNVDFLHARTLSRSEISQLQADGKESIELTLPSTEKHVNLKMTILETEAKILERCLDCLPFASLSWSIHRGLRDILVAFARSTMERHRTCLAEQIKKYISQFPVHFETVGWHADFVRGAMPDLAANSILAGTGNSGDSVRVATDAVMLMTRKTMTELDETHFWRAERHNLEDDATTPLTMDVVIALTKCFILEWSVEFDYQMYHDLPPNLLFR